ncbi:MAG: thymidine kinase [Trueperaceae bacterium]|nr:thymidine kinase [Trueperaceae bacterium]MCH2666548.1 thymidine kinase [Deinococcales bacterium]|tara:strand:- start:348 stop:971 length:624 start_codon:yes stop_codon:yes gene_type:complete
MPFYEFGGGWLEVITGPMFSGKSEELIRRVTRALIAGQNVQVFKPTLDDRYDAVAIASHNGRKLEAQPISSIDDIASLLRKDTQVVAVDEVQFLSKAFTPLALQLADQGTRVIIAGLDLDFRGIPFGPMPELLSQAEVVVKLTAICSCGRAATRTQRLIQGQPAHTSDPVILVGAFESYEPRCREHHIVLTAERLTPLFGTKSSLVE